MPDDVKSPDTAEGEAGDLDILRSEGGDEGGEAQSVEKRETPTKDKKTAEKPLLEDEEVVDETGEEEGEGEEGEKLSSESADELDELLEDEPTIYPRPSFKEVTAKYPALFKDFPNLRQAFFREKEFTDRFPTVEDADEALTKAQNLDVVSEAVATGNVGTLLDNMEPSDVKKVAANFLPSLFKKDQNLYYSVTGPLIDRLIKQAYSEAVSSGNENLKHSAEWLAKWCFGDTKYASGEAAVKPISTEPDEGQKKLDEERSKFQMEKYNEAKTTVVASVTTRMLKEIESGIGDGVSPKMRQMIAREVLTEVSGLLEKDQRHLRQMNALWKRAQGAGFSNEHRARIASTYLARAKTLIPAVRSRIRREVLGQQTQEEPKSNTTRHVVSGGAPTSTRGIPRDPKKINWDKTSDLDLLRGKAVLKS